MEHHVQHSDGPGLQERMSHRQLQEFARNANGTVNNGCSSDTEGSKGQVLAVGEEKWG